MARYNSATRAEEPTSTLSSFTVLQLLASILTCLPMKYILFLPHLAESDDTVSAQTPPLRRRTHTGLVRSQSDGPFRGPFVRSGAVVSTCPEAAHTTRQGGHARVCGVDPVSHNLHGGFSTRLTCSLVQSLWELSLQ